MHKYQLSEWVLSPVFVHLTEDEAEQLNPRAVEPIYPQDRYSLHRVELPRPRRGQLVLVQCSCGAFYRELVQLVGSEGARCSLCSSRVSWKLRAVQKQLVDRALHQE
jgi:DNA-directed RNA polymerase subunit RPC12/RpoP